MDLVQWTLATSPYPTLPVPNRYRYHQISFLSGPASPPSGLGFIIVGVRYCLIYIFEVQL